MNRKTTVYRHMLFEAYDVKGTPAVLLEIGSRAMFCIGDADEPVDSIFDLSPLQADAFAKVLAAALKQYRSLPAKQRIAIEKRHSDADARLRAKGYREFLAAQKKNAAQKGGAA